MASETARRLRKAMTPQEVKLWVRLRGLRVLGLHFRRQSPIAGFVVDFECRRARLVVEIDGGQHATDEHSRSDRRRDDELERAGYRVVRFWNHDREMDAVLEKIARSARRHPARPRAARAATLP
jgi:very-short-patch-repair endonuclease